MAAPGTERPTGSSAGLRPSHPTAAGRACAWQSGLTGGDQGPETLRPDLSLQPAPEYDDCTTDPDYGVDGGLLDHRAAQRSLATFKDAVDALGPCAWRAFHGASTGPRVQGPGIPRSGSGCTAGGVHVRRIAAPRLQAESGSTSAAGAGSSPNPRGGRTWGRSWTPMPPWALQSTGCTTRKAVHSGAGTGRYGETGPHPATAREGKWPVYHSYDDGRKVKGRKRHLAVDTRGLLPASDGHPADARECCPQVRKVRTDAGPKLGDRVRAHMPWDPGTVRRLPGPAPAPGGGAHLQLAPPAAVPRQGLRGPVRDLGGLDPDRHDRAHAASSGP